MDDSGFDSDPKQLKLNEDEQLFPVIKNNNLIMLPILNLIMLSICMNKIIMICFNSTIIIIQFQF